MFSLLAYGAQSSDLRNVDETDLDSLMRSKSPCRASMQFIPETSIRMPFLLTPFAFSLALGVAIYLPIHPTLFASLYPRFAVPPVPSVRTKRRFISLRSHINSTHSFFDLDPNKVHYVSRPFPEPQDFPRPPALHSPGMFMSHECIPYCIFRPKTYRDRPLAR